MVLRKRAWHLQQRLTIGLIAAGVVALGAVLWFDLPPHSVGRAWVLVLLLPLLGWYAVRDLTSRLELTEEGIQGRAATGFGRLWLRRGQTPLLRWDDVTRVESYLWVEKGREGEMHAVRIEGRRGANRWHFEITPDMVGWKEGVAFATLRVRGAAVEPAVLDLIEQRPLPRSN